MGTSKSAAEFARKIEKMGTVTETRAGQTVDRGAFTVKTIILEQAASQGVPPTAKIAGGRWGVRYQVAPGRTPSALVRITGAFHLVERDTKAHPLAPKTKGRGARKKALAFNGVARASAMHPGTHGKGIFAKAKVTAGRVAPRVMAQSVVSGWHDALK